MATRERTVTPLLRRVGILRHRRLIERDDTAYFMRSPEMMRRLQAAIRRADQGMGRSVTEDEVRAMLGLAE